ncbi:hypothetical protein GGR32_001447 [Mesonia hippocampi]|uniref:Serine aminopeptidase S33 domain-containing protein n=1 Tax=Mesonia hippocampi TaxID=1628250 RepID=A0A840EQ15_9FLAO|nr:alpha/beta fold hydrolase [Mesonia hippocampi]MBB4119151.1 hypothetical protein [Mesonia hippocampi]
MKKYFLYIALFLYTCPNIMGQTLSGQWSGKINFQGAQLRLAFTFSQSEAGKLQATMSSPDQSVYDIPADSVYFVNDSLKIAVNQFGITYQAKKTKPTKFNGVFEQAGFKLPLELNFDAIPTSKKEKPQTPKPPFSYQVENITFPNNKENFKLAGTLSLPKNKTNLPAVILISGSGKHNRNQEILGHKPFWVIADYLTKNGIAVLRFDDRGVAESEGNFDDATSKDFANDAEAAFNYLRNRKEINSKKIGLLGHSEGGIIAPIVALNNPDVAFMVLLAAPGLSGDEILLLQQELIGKANNINPKSLKKLIQTNQKLFEIVKTTDDKEFLNQKLTETLKTHSDKLNVYNINENKFIDNSIKGLTTPWMKFFLSYNPAPTLQKINCPVFALNGEKDIQVPAKENLAAIKNAFAKNKQAKLTLKEYPQLNHLFQECNLCNLTEYGQLEQSISPIVLKDITQWILKQTSKKY